MSTVQLGLFPLQMILLPGEVAQLYIFEERYRQLVADWESTGMGFGIPFARNGVLTNVGSLVEVKQILKKNADGSSHIQIECVDVFKVIAFNNQFGDKLYPGGSASILHRSTLPRVSEAVMSELDEFLKNNYPDQIPMALSTTLDVYDVGRLAKLSDDDKIKLLKRSEHQRQEQLLINHFKLEAALFSQKGSQWRNIILN